MLPETVNQWIEKLNEVALLLSETTGMSGAEIIERTADEYDLELVKDGENSRIYRLPDGSLVNAWTEGVLTDEVGEGGIGFDDQIEWYTQGVPNG